MQGDDERALHEEYAREVLRQPGVFLRRLYEATPALRVTPVIVALNVAVFAWATWRGASPLAPSADVLLALGGDSAVLVAEGQWWRLLTSMFLHAGILHVGMNMYVLVQGGRVVERLFGPSAFLVLYVLAGLAGSVTSVLVHPQVAVGVGASGAVFGVFGGLGGYLLAERRLMPRAVLASMRRVLVEFVGLNLVIGLAVPFIDLSAHLGGLVAGGVLGVALARPLTREGVASRGLRAAIIAVLGAAAIAAVVRFVLLR